MVRKNNFSLLKFTSAAVFGWSSLASSLFGVEASNTCSVSQPDCEHATYSESADQNQPLVLKALFPKVADGLTKATKAKK